MIPLSEHLPGIVWAGFMGLVTGNFATSPIYRLPRNAPLFVEDPFCDHCHAPLKPRDLFPVFSWLSTGGKCRYCGAAIPGFYTFIEAMMGALFIAAYLVFGFSEPFLLVTLGMTSFVMLGIMLSQDDYFSNRTLMACFMLGAVYRTLENGTIYGFMGGMFTALIIGAGFWRLTRKPLTRNITEWPAVLKMLIMAGVWLPLPQLFAVAVLVMAESPLVRRRPYIQVWTIIAYSILFLLIRSPA